MHNEEEAYKLYDDYAIQIGFSVRKENSDMQKMV